MVEVEQAEAEIQSVQTAQEVRHNQNRKKYQIRCGNKIEHRNITIIDF